MIRCTIVRFQKISISIQRGGARSYEAKICTEKDKASLEFPKGKGVNSPPPKKKCHGGRKLIFSAIQHIVQYIVGSPLTKTAINIYHSNNI